METALLLIGVVFFLVCTLVFLRQAFASTLGWGMAGLIFPPTAVVFYVASWKRLKPLAVVHLASALLLVLVAMIWVRAHPYSFDDSRLEWLRDIWAPAFSATPMVIEANRYVSERDLLPYLHSHDFPGGEFVGQKVTFVRTTLVNNILRFKSDENVFSRIEVAIPLDNIELKPGENLLEYAPASTDSPSIHVTYYADGEPTPEVLVFTRRFWLELLVSVKEGYVYTGYVKLRLPDRNRSFLAGEFRAFTRDLRFDGDVVDRFFDSNATVEYVAEQYLINKLGNMLDKVTRFDETFFQTALENPTGRTDATLKLVDGSEHIVKMTLLKGSEGWVVDNGPTADLINALRRMRREPSASISPMPVRDRIRVIDPQTLDSLIGKDVVISTRDGKQREGTISEVDQHNVTLATPIEGGTMGMLVKRREITEVKLSH